MGMVAEQNPSIATCFGLRNQMIKPIDKILFFGRIPEDILTDVII
jgi:hypothetical protein